MPDKRCPHCRLWNSETALVCDCGFDFSTGTMSGVRTSDGPSVPESWHIGLLVLAIALIPAFLLGAFLSRQLGKLPPLMTMIQLALLVLPPFYWLFYFTRIERAWARWLILLMGLVCMLITGLIAVSIVMRIINPQ